jgi:ribonuclease HI/retron-type reverse transcriptase
MYQSLGRWGGSKQPAGVHARQGSAEAHCGHWQDFLRRHERDADRAARNGVQGIRQLAPKLARRVADARNLRASAEYSKQKGDRAPGPNGIRLAELEDHEIWEMCRVLGAAIRSGEYLAGKGRRKRIPKGESFRELGLQDIEDKVVGGGIVNIVQPLLDSLFDDHSNGFRPGRGREHAMAQAMTVSRQQGRLVWMTTDLADAFDRVPLQRLKQVLAIYLPMELAELMVQVAGASKKRGLLQGQPLSPLLLNVYLHHVLDRPWRKLHPDLPLFRTADDILVVCRTVEEARQARANLERLLVPAGMKLSGSEAKNGITDLTQGDAAEWLGLTVSINADKYEVGIAEKTWWKLYQTLEQAHELPAPAMIAHEAIRGWIRQLGATYQAEDRTQVYERVVSLARELSHEEIPDYQTFQDDWRQASVRWLRLHRRIQLAEGKIGGSACHSLTAIVCRSDGAPSGVPSQFFNNGQPVTLYTNGSCDRTTKKGGWAAILRAPHARTVRLAGHMPRTTNNRAELTAVIKGLSRLDRDTPVQVVTDSEYVASGISKNVYRWKLQGWRAGSGNRKRPLKNVDLWQQLYELIGTRDVTCHWVRGHAGNRWNQECDRLARAATEMLMKK